MGRDVFICLSPLCGSNVLMTFEGKTIGVELADKDIEELDDKPLQKPPKCFPRGYRFH